MTSFYVAEGDRFVSTELTRGPWSALHQHGGPAAALMARELERRLADEADGTPLTRRAGTRDAATTTHARPHHVATRRRARHATR